MGEWSIIVTWERADFDKVIAGTPTGYGLDISSTGVRLLGCTNFEPRITLSDNTTYHIVGVADGEGKGAIYVNGSLVGAGPHSSCSAYYRVSSYRRRQ